MHGLSVLCFGDSGLGAEAASIVVTVVPLSGVSVVQHYVFCESGIQREISFSMYQCSIVQL